MEAEELREVERIVNEALRMNPPPPTLWMCFADTIDRWFYKDEFERGYRAELAERDWSCVRGHLDNWLIVLGFLDTEVVLKHGKKVREVAEALIRKEIPCWRLEVVAAELALNKFRFNEEHKRRNPHLVKNRYASVYSEDHYYKRLSDAEYYSARTYIPILQTWM